MFDKPNTSGFIHISYYLLSIYNAKRFQKLVPWPIMNKTDERKYRTEIKNYLDVLASENPDIKFPSVLMSHLLRSGGTKFSILMWKISEISLRAYIRKNCKLSNIKLMLHVLIHGVHMSIHFLQIKRTYYKRQIATITK